MTSASILQPAATPDLSQMIDPSDLLDQLDSVGEEPISIIRPRPRRHKPFEIQDPTIPRLGTLLLSLVVLAAGLTLTSFSLIPGIILAIIGLVGLPLGPSCPMPLFEPADPVSEQWNALEQRINQYPESPVHLITHASYTEKGAVTLTLSGYYQNGECWYGRVLRSEELTAGDQDKAMDMNGDWRSEADAVETQLSEQNFQAKLLQAQGMDEAKQLATALNSVN